MKIQKCYMWDSEADARQHIKLFKDERARVRRMVRKLKKYYQAEQDKYNAKQAYSAAVGCGHKSMACDDILATLKEGR